MVAITMSMKNTRATNLVNFGPVTSKFVWLICMDDESTYAKIRCALAFNGRLLDGSSIASL